MCLCILGTIFINTVPEEAQKMLLAAEKLSSSIQSMSYMYLSSLCVYHIILSLNGPNLPNPLSSKILSLKSKIKEDDKISKELLKNLIRASQNNTFAFHPLYTLPSRQPV